MTTKKDTFIEKYTPSYLRDFDYTHDSDETRECNKTTFILRTLMEIDDLNILLIGGANSGKTTMLYALLREYYGLSKNANIPETNIMFINNLKEQGIKFFKNEMKTFCQSHCSIYGKKKIVVIDDIDTVNKQSQQVFRNYIDKYQSNIHIVSSCANAQKVIESLQSRLHIIRIQPPTVKQIEQMMDRILREEVIFIDQGCREYLMERSNYNVRTVITNLEKLKIYSEPGVILSRAVCEPLCSTISFHQFEEYVAAVKRGDLAEAVRIFYAIYDYGYSLIDILEYFFAFIKCSTLLTEDEKYQTIPLLCKYITVFHNVHENCVELALFTNNLSRRGLFESTIGGFLPLPNPLPLRPLPL
jgi:DNA polymerase III delta prime subunit